MTKEELYDYDKLLFCRTCNRYVPKTHIYHKRVYKNGDISKCNVCLWIERHGGLPVIDGFDNNEVFEALHFFIYEESELINDLAKKLNRSVPEMLCLYDSLNLKSKRCLIETECEYCKNIISVYPSVYKKNLHLYCSNECYWKDKPNKIDKGKDSKFYNRIKTQCTFCGKTIEVIPHKYNTKNSYGDNNNFCSQKCYSEFRKIYYVGEKSPMFNYQFSEEQLLAIRKRQSKKSKDTNRLNSSIQIKINEILDLNNITYQREYNIGYYSIDNFLTESGLIIEVMGDYWHSSPLKYNECKYKINQIQERTLQHDKEKLSYIKNHYGISILYLWEQDINENPLLCEKLILKYIKEKGIIADYNSFNWELQNDKLFLKKDIIIPYQNKRKVEYEHLFKRNITETLTTAGCM